MTSRDSRPKRLEYRCPHPTSNIYLALAAITMAMLDGIERRLDPGEPVEENIYHGLSAAASRDTRTSYAPSACPEGVTRAPGHGAPLEGRSNVAVVSHPPSRLEPTVQAIVRGAR